MVATIGWVYGNGMEDGGKVITLIFDSVIAFVCLYDLMFCVIVCFGVSHMINEKWKMKNEKRTTSGREVASMKFQNQTKWNEMLKMVKRERSISIKF